MIIGSQGNIHFNFDKPASFQLARNARKMESARLC